MITRRNLIKWGVIAPAIAGTAQAAFAGVPAEVDMLGLDALVLDTRHLTEGPEGMAARAIHRFDGDVTALWFDTLDPAWRKRGFVVGGVTGRDALFVLETLAADRGRRVVSRELLPAAADGTEGPVAWVIAPVHPSVLP